MVRGIVMLTEVFWPKEMKELVTKYRAEGTLKEEAVHNLNKNIKKHFAVGCVLALVMGMAASFWVGLIILIVTPFAVKFDIYCIFKNQIGVYSFGRKEMATVKSFGVSLHGTQLLRYEITSGSEKLSGRMWIGAVPRIKKEDYPQKGDVIPVFFDRNQRYKAMPDIGYLNHHYSLNT